MSERPRKVRAPFYSTYSSLQLTIPLFDGVLKSQITHMSKTIGNQTGTPQNPVNWTNPDEWIPERLTGSDKAIAQKIWDGSGKKVNPRFVEEQHAIISAYSLLETDAEGVYHLTDLGRKFLADDPETIRYLDEEEGLLALLSIIASKGEAKRADLIPEWTLFLQENSAYASESTISQTLHYRLKNLLERHLISRSGNRYRITDPGSENIKGYQREGPSSVLQVIDAYNSDMRNEFREKLHLMPPYQFEQLISQLLEAMGYEDVETTKESGDKGVDVVGNVEVGITSIREVVQVKRMSSNVQRQILDQLRGALPYHQAIRGTIITLSDFSKGCTEAAMFSGAAPITLINGTKLIELLEEHNIGLKRRPAELLEIDREYFEAIDQVPATEE